MMMLYLHENFEYFNNNMSNRATPEPGSNKKTKIPKS